MLFHHVGGFVMSDVLGEVGVVAGALWLDNKFAPLIGLVNATQAKRYNPKIPKNAAHFNF
jgi:hypothetical protein